MREAKIQDNKKSVSVRVPCYGTRTDTDLYCHWYLSATNCQRHRITDSTFGLFQYELLSVSDINAIALHFIHTATLQIIRIAVLQVAVVFFNSVYAKR